ncbi:MAG: calcium-binding protein, partial [Pirellulaceae bacterium]
ITTDDTSVKFGSMLEFDDIRIGVENFGITYGSSLQFTGNIYVASGGATLFPDGPVSATITDSNRATDVDSSTGLPDDEAIRLGISFDDNGQVEGFQFDIDTMEVSIADVVTLRTQDFVLDTTASSNEELVSFTSVSATVEIGSLMLTGEGRNFAFMGDGSFMAKEGFGVFLSVGSATGESFKWPSWLPVKIHSIGIEWDDFNADSSDFNLVLSLSISSMPSAPGLKFSGTIEGVKIKPSLLLEGKFPVIDIAAIGVSVSGPMFGGELNAALIGGILKIDAAGNKIDVLDSVTPVADRVMYMGISGGFEMLGSGGFEIRLGLSELGPLGVFISASTPTGIMLEPNTGLTINDFSAGVEFFKSLPAIDDPYELRNPEFGLPTDMTTEAWLASLQDQVVQQYQAIQANPSMSGFGAAFTAPMTITGGAKIYSAYTSKQLFNGEVMIKISTDGKFLVVGKLNFANDNISLSGKLYADLSKISEGAATVLFLADIPDQVRLLTIHGKLQMGFRNASGEEVTFDVVDGAVADPASLKPQGSLIDPTNGSIDSNVINDASRKFDNKPFIDVSFTPADGNSLDYGSVLDSDAEFTLTRNGTAIGVSGTPTPIVTTVSDAGVVTTAELVPDGGETLEDAIRRTGTNRFRYTLTDAGYTFEKDEYTISFNANSFKHVDKELDNGSTETGTGNDAADATFTVDGATAVLLDPGNDGGIDIELLNARGYLDIRYKPSAGATLDESSITDASGEFEISGTAATGVVVDGAATKIDDTTYRYSFTGIFGTGDVDVAFLIARWTDDASNDNRAISQSFRVEGSTADLSVPSGGGTIGVTEINNNQYIEVSFLPTSGNTLNHDTINGDEITLFDSDNNEISLSGLPERVESSNRYRYNLDSAIEAGTYTLNIAPASFEDTAGTGNLAETESFTVETAAATVVDPKPLDVFDRETLNARKYLDVEFQTTTGNEFSNASVDSADRETAINSILDAGDEFTLAGAGGENAELSGTPDVYYRTGTGDDYVEATGNISEIVTAIENADSVVFRYSYNNSLDAGMLNVNFVAGSWEDAAGNEGSAGTKQIALITQAENFFIEVSGGIELNAADLFDEPLMSVTAEVSLEMDFARKVFQMEFSGEMQIIKLGNVGATAGRFVLDSSDENSSIPKFWGVASLETNFSELEQYGLYLGGSGTLQINTTENEKTETLTLKGIGDNNEDITKTYVLPAQSFAVEVVGYMRLEVANTELFRMQGGFYLGINPNKFEVFATAELSIGSGSNQLTLGDARGLLVVRTGQDGATPGVAGTFSLSAGADLGLPDMGSLLSMEGSVSVMFNTTMQRQVFEIPESFLPLLDEGDPTTIEIFAAAPSLDGTEDLSATPAVYFSTTIFAQITLLDTVTLAGFVQIEAAVEANGQGYFEVTGAVTTEVEHLGALSGTLNFKLYAGVAPGTKVGMAGRVQLALDVNGIPGVEVEGDFVLEFNAVLTVPQSGETVFSEGLVQPIDLETFIIGDDGKFERNPDGSFKVGTATINPGLKFMLAGKLVFADTLELSGKFTMEISPEKLEVTVDAVLKLDPLGELNASGGLRIDQQGLTLYASLSVDVSFGEDIGISFSASAYVSINTTGTNQVINGQNVVDGILLEFNGEIEFLGFASASGSTKIHVSATQIEMEFALSFNLGGLSFAANGAAGVYVGSNPGLALRLNVSVTADVAVFRIEASGELELNTTAVSRLGIQKESFYLRLAGEVSVLEVLNMDTSFSVLVANGGWEINFTANMDFFGLVTLGANGWVKSTGEFDIFLNGGFTIGSSSFGLTGNASFHVWNTVELVNGNDVYSFGLSISANMEARIFGITLAGVGFDATFSVTGSGRTKIELSVTARIKILFVTISKTATFTVGYLQLPEPTYLAGSSGSPQTWTASNGDGEGTDDPSRTLYLNVGDRAGHRNIGEDDTADPYTIVQLDGDAHEGTIQVKAFGRSNIYEDVQQIVGDFESGDDYVHIDSSVKLPIEINGGSGDDNIIYEGQGNPNTVTIHGDGGNDFIQNAGPGEIEIFGDEGDDLLQAISGTIIAEGGIGNDQLIGFTGNDTLKGNDGNDVITGGGGANTVFGGSGDDQINVTTADDGTIDAGDDIDYVVLTATENSDTILFRHGLVNNDLFTPAAADAQEIAITIGSEHTNLTNAETIVLYANEGADNITVEDLTQADLTKLQIEAGKIVTATGTTTQENEDGELEEVTTYSYANDGALDMITVYGSSIADSFILTPEGPTSEGVITPQFTRARVTHTRSSNGYDLEIAQTVRAEGDRLTIISQDGDDLVDASLLSTSQTMTLDGNSVEVVAPDMLVIDIQTGNGSDVLIGTAYQDYLAGGEGSDTYTGADGKDFFSDVDSDGNDYDTLIETFNRDVTLTDSTLTVGTILSDTDGQFVTGDPVTQEELEEAVKQDNPDYAMGNSGDRYAADATHENLDYIFEEAQISGGDSKNVLVTGDRDGIITIGSTAYPVSDWTASVILDNKGNTTNPLPEVYILNVTGGNNSNLSIRDSGAGEGFDHLVVFGSNGADTIVLDTIATTGLVTIGEEPGLEDPDTRDRLTYRGMELVQ